MKLSELLSLSEGYIIGTGSSFSKTMNFSSEEEAKKGIADHTKKSPGHTYKISQMNSGKFTIAVRKNDKLLGWLSNKNVVTEDHSIIGAGSSYSASMEFTSEEAAKKAIASHTKKTDGRYTYKISTMKDGTITVSVRNANKTVAGWLTNK